MTKKRDMIALIIRRNPTAAASLGLVVLLMLSGCDVSPDLPLVVDNSLIKACIRATACDVRPYPTVSNCLAYYEDIGRSSDLKAVYFQIYTCVNRADNCSAVRDCFGADQPCDKTYLGRCVQGKAYFCDLLDDMSYRYDCAAAGLSCVLDSAFPHDATCQGDASSGSSLSTAVNCKDGHCRETGEECDTGDQYNRCDGPALQACLKDHWITFDCAMLGLAPCQRVQQQWARCSDPSSNP